MTPRRRPAVSVFVLGTLAVVTACGGAQGSANSPTGPGASVRTWKGDPPAECKELGIVEAASQGCTAACQLRRMKDAAAELGANSLRIDYLSGGSAASGTAFDCPGQSSGTSAPEAGTAPESPASEHEPEETDTSTAPDSDEADSAEPDG